MNAHMKAMGGIGQGHKHTANVRNAGNAWLQYAHMRWRFMTRRRRAAYRCSNAVAAGFGNGIHRKTNRFFSEVIRMVFEKSFGASLS